MVHEVIGLDVIAILRAQPDARAIIQSKPPLLWLFLWRFKHLALPSTRQTAIISQETLQAWVSSWPSLVLCCPKYRRGPLQRGRLTTSNAQLSAPATYCFSTESAVLVGYVLIENRRSFLVL